jgi:outer membrane lipoprotein SlyB
MASVRRIIVGWCAAWLACISVPAEAQRARAPLTEMPVRIDGIDVEEVARLDPGTRLSFSVFGTPGAVASLQIEGARHGLVLREAERGVYEGTYTIEPDERIAANAPVVATLRRGAEVAQSVLEEPLVLGAAMPDGRTASARAAPVAEPRPAEVAPPPRSSAPTRPLQRNVACTDCAVVESVRAVETDGRNGVAGAVAGGLLGAILGHQIGHGDLRGFAGILGAVGGALTGRAIERAGTRQVRYDVVLRLPDGGSQVHSYDAPPPVRVGERIRVPPVITARTSRLDAPD